MNYIKFIKIYKIHLKEVGNAPMTYPDVLQEDPASSLVLQLHQFLTMLTLLMGLIAEELGKVVQCDVITVEVVRLQNKKTLIV